MAGVVSDVFGPIVTGSQIEQAVAKTLRKWYPTYLAEIERQLDMEKGLLKHPQNYTNRNSFDAQAGEKTPKIVVISPGTDGTPTKNGTSWRATWRVGVGIAVGAKTEEEADRQLKAYVGAARAILIQNVETISQMGLPTVEETQWLGESYDDLDDIPQQHILYKAATLLFTVDINVVTARRGGPEVPVLSVPATYPIVPDSDHVIIGLEDTGV